jgi:hypothetical protein
MKKKDQVIGIPSEIDEGCHCIALVPQVVKSLVAEGHRVGPRLFPKPGRSTGKLMLFLNSGLPKLTEDRASTSWT